MKYYKTTTKYNCGIDLHTRQMYICVMDQEGNILVHRNIRNNDFQFFLKLVEPYKDDLTVTCERCFVCFWLADACEDAGIKFVLAHAYYVRSIAMNKHKNDKLDSQELAECLRTNRIPPAYVCPRDLRPVRKLLRRRNKYVKNRAELTGYSTCEMMAAGNQPLTISTNSKERCWEGIRSSFDNPVDSFSLNDIAKIIITGTSDPHWHSRQNACIDIRDIYLTVPYIHFNLISQALNASKISLETKHALIVKRGLSQAIAKLWINHVNTNWNAEFRCFTELNEASDWLDINPQTLHSEMLKMRNC